MEGRTDRDTAAIVCALAERDQYTADHSERVEALVLEMGNRTALESAQLQKLLYVARLHDIGKIGVPDRVLLKPGPLTATEQMEMRTHPECGYKILRTIEDFDAEVAQGVLHHHEAFDGSGYPEGLQGEQVPVLARIISLVDCYDAMASDRPYRKGMPHADIMEIMFEKFEGKFDPYIAGKFKQLIENSPYRVA